MRPSPPTSPSSTTRAGRRRAPRRRWPRRASGPASPASRARPGNERPGSLAGYRRTAGDRGRGQARPFGAADLAAVLATCHRPRRRGRGVESDPVASERGRLDAVIAGLLFMAGMRRSEVSALHWADVDDAADGDGVLVTSAGARRTRRARRRTSQTPSRSSAVLESATDSGSWSRQPRIRPAGCGAGRRRRPTASAAAGGPWGARRCGRARRRRGARGIRRPRPRKRPRLPSAAWHRILTGGSRARVFQPSEYPAQWRGISGALPGSRLRERQPCAGVNVSRSPGPSTYSAGATFGGQRSPRLKVTASKGRMRTGASSCAVAISTHSPSRSSKASRVRTSGSTSHR